MKLFHPGMPIFFGHVHEKPFNFDKAAYFEKLLNDLGPERNKALHDEKRLLEAQRELDLRHQDLQTLISAFLPLADGISEPRFLFPRRPLMGDHILYTLSTKL